jgi:hypothetical protein
VVLVATGSTGLATGTTTYNGCENIAAGTVRLLPNTLAAPFNACLTANVIAARHLSTALTEVGVMWNQQGPPGAQGAIGAAGATGAPGAQGVPGPKGDTGPAGAQGAQGLKGDTGAQGAQGLKGDTGAIGAQGAQGLKGDSGAQGPAGAAGGQGPAGPQGAQGVPGPPGGALTSIDQLAGTSCALSSSLTGAVTISYSNTGTITFACVANDGLSVIALGNGTGTTTSSDGFIACGSTCDHTYFEGTSVTLAAQPDATATFGGWGGACSGHQLTCTVLIATAETVTATFNLNPIYTLLVSIGGDGTGAITSSIPGLTCGATQCSQSLLGGTAVTLTASANSASRFAGWGGACSGSQATCTVILTSAKSVSATFNKLAIYTLEVQVGGTGGGTVDDGPGAQLACAILPGDGLAVCSAQYYDGTTVTLTAKAISGSVFDGWGTSCAGYALTCTVTVSGGLVVSAQFDLAVAAQVTVTGNTTPCATTDIFLDPVGSCWVEGFVSTSPYGYSCDNYKPYFVGVPTNTCTEPIAFGSTVTFTAIPNSAQSVIEIGPNGQGTVTPVFDRWGGDCASAGSQPTCTIAITPTMQISANFVNGPFTG